MCKAAHNPLSLALSSSSNLRPYNALHVYYMVRTRVVNPLPSFVHRFPHSLRNAQACNVPDAPLGSSAGIDARYSSGPESLTSSSVHPHDGTGQEDGSSGKSEMANVELRRDSGWFLHCHHSRDGQSNHSSVRAGGGARRERRVSAIFIAGMWRY